MYFCCGSLNRGWCALLIRLCPLIVVFFSTTLGAEVLLPCSHIGSSFAYPKKIFAPWFGSFTKKNSPLLAGTNTSLESSNMLNKSLDIWSKMTLNISGIIAILWNTSSTYAILQEKISQWELNYQPLHSEIGTSLLSPNSLRSSLTLS